MALAPTTPVITPTKPMTTAGCRWLTPCHIGRNWSEVTSSQTAIGPATRAAQALHAKSRRLLSWLST